VTISIPRMGDGFILREFTRDDIEGLAAIEFDPTAKQFLAVPAKERQEWINSFVPETAIGWAVDVGGHLAGRASLSGRKRGYRELVIVIGQSYWGLGLGRKVAAMLISAAFDELQAKSLVALVHPEHKASIALLRRFKFRRRGIFKAESAHWQDGHFIYCLSRRSHELQAITTKLPGMVPRREWP
jgi:RimJ/RimL family protein N-acetyltransferase